MTRAAYRDTREDVQSASESGSMEQLDIGVIDRQDGPDVWVSAAEFLQHAEHIESLQKTIAEMRDALTVAHSTLKHRLPELTDQIGSIEALLSNTGAVVAASDWVRLSDWQTRGGVLESIEFALKGERRKYVSKRLTDATDKVVDLVNRDNIAADPA